MIDCMNGSDTTGILRFLQNAEHPLLVLVGPTASGKTALSLSLALKLAAHGCSVEIINADSRQLYRFLDIGTAKIKQEEMSGIRHHLLDVLDPNEEATVAWYKREVDDCIVQMRNRGSIPFLVGGSMLYVSAILDNLSFVAQANSDLRAALRLRLAEKGSDALYRELQELDPEGALSIDPRNPVYLVRALEICLSTGMRLSEAKKRNPSPYDLLVIGITPSRSELHDRITRRVRQMFTDGWVEEVVQLLRQGYTSEDPGMQSLGYRDIASALAADTVEHVKENALLKEKIAASIRQYARRQLTWWRRDGRIRWQSA